MADVKRTGGLEKWKSLYHEGVMAKHIEVSDEAIQKVLDNGSVRFEERVREIQRSIPRAYDSKVLAPWWRAHREEIVSRVPRVPSLG